MFSRFKKKILFFIVVVIDRPSCGVPNCGVSLPFFLFSASSENEHTAAGYDADILEHMLFYQKQSPRDLNGEHFDPLVATMDADLMEQDALLFVFPHIWLPIRRFHLCQFRKNSLIKCLCGISTEPGRTQLEELL